MNRTNRAIAPGNKPGKCDLHPLWIIHLTSQPQEVIDRAQQLHGHVIMHQGVLQHPGLQTQIPHVLPHAALTALLIVPEEEQAEKHSAFTHTAQFFISARSQVQVTSAMFNSRSFISGGSMSSLWLASYGAQICWCGFASSFVFCLSPVLTDREGSWRWRDGCRGKGMHRQNAGDFS